MFDQYDPTDEAERESMFTYLKMVVRQVALLAPSALKRHEEWSQEQQALQDAWMPIVDPTRYHNSMHNGAFEDQRFQAKMLSLIVQLNSVIHEREKAMSPHRARLAREEVE